MPPRWQCSHSSLILVPRTRDRGDAVWVLGTSIVMLVHAELVTAVERRCTYTVLWLRGPGDFSRDGPWPAVTWVRGVSVLCPSWTASQASLRMKVFRVQFFAIARPVISPILTVKGEIERVRSSHRQSTPTTWRMAHVVLTILRSGDARCSTEVVNYSCSLYSWFVGSSPTTRLEALWSDKRFSPTAHPCSITNQREMRERARSPTTVS